MHPSKQPVAAVADQSSKAPAARRFAFGAYRFHPATGQLLGAEQEVRLSPKASAVLETLVARAGQPVAKEALIAAAWPGVVVTDNSLTKCIRELRAALDDDPREPRYIETWHRRGYRFVAPVTEADDEASPELAEPAPSETITSIAVLPFVDMSPERDQDYLCDGLAEELISALTYVDGLRVAARSSSFQFRGPGADVRAVGRQLDVAALLEGSVRKAGDRLRVTVQLVDVASGYHKWSQRFDRKLDDVFAVQDEIAQAVATLLRGGALSRREQQGLHRTETALDAYECYLRGRQLLHRMEQSDLKRSCEMLARAVELDPKYAPAWAGLATVHAVLYEWYVTTEADLEQAERASRRALELAPRLADAHVARGLALSLIGRYEEASREFEEAIGLNPNLFDAYYYYARSAFASGNVARSAELFYKAGDARREDFQAPLLLEQSLRILGRVDEAARMRREGIARAEHALELNPLDSRALALLSTGYAEDGDFERGFECSRRGLEHYPDDANTLINSACLRAKAGMKEEAIELLERVFAKGYGKRDWILHDPDYDSLRDDPRFQAMLARMH